MTSNDSDQFSASASALGYIYQCRYALYEALRRLRENQEFLVSIETLDDVVFEEIGEAVELLQTKHHVNNTCNLTDASVELWKTLRIWCERLENNEIDEGSTLYLVTTATISSGFAPFFLKGDDNRNIESAKERLNSTATTSTNTTNASAYAAYNRMSDDKKNTLLNMVYILDRSPDILNIEANLKEALFYAVKSEFLESLLQRLEGWWFKRVIRQLKVGGSDAILDKEITAELNRLREQFKEESLPIDDDLMTASIDAIGYKDHIFVKQLELINIGNKRIFHAVRNYFRAAEHRSRWLREDLLLVGELDRYEEQLIEEWELIFEQKKDGLGEEAAESDKIRAAKAIYIWIENNSHPSIRSGVTEPAIARGSYQILSNSQKVGWHIEFKNRLKVLLEGTGGEQ